MDARAYRISSRYRPLNSIWHASCKTPRERTYTGSAIFDGRFSDAARRQRDDSKRGGSEVRRWNDSQGFSRRLEAGSSRRKQGCKMGVHLIKPHLASTSPLTVLRMRTHGSGRVRLWPRVIRWTMEYEGPPGSSQGYPTEYSTPPGSAESTFSTRQLHWVVAVVYISSMLHSTRL